MKTRNYLLLMFLLLLGLKREGWAESVTFGLAGKNATNQITFYSKAPVEDFEGVAEELSGAVTLDFSKPNFNLEGWVSVPVASMNTGMAMRDQHMRSADWLNAEKYPVIQFTLAAAPEQTVKKKGENQWVLNAVGQFHLKGHEKKMIVPLTLTKGISRGEEQISVVGRFNVSLKEFGITGPRALNIIGARVGDEVVVKFKIVGKKEKEWGSPPTKNRIW